MAQPLHSAQWIGGEEPKSVPYLGRDFQCNKSIRKATLYATALGVFTMKLNGKSVTENRLEPGESQWDQTVLYCTYDVTSLVRRGHNRLLAKLGGGLFHITPIGGPWTCRGFVSTSANHGFTIHPSVIQFKGKWYYIYHDGSYNLNGAPGGDCRRSVCAEYLRFNSDGTIRFIPLTQEGISKIKDKQN